MSQLVLLRHGESEWNKANRFTGWTDVDLTPTGIDEAVRAGRRLKNAGFGFDIAYTSVLKRAIRTLWLVLDVLDLMWVPVEKTWRLNERHYGALQGLNKAETARLRGEAVVHAWRRSFAARPPALERDDPRFPGHDPRYRDVPPELLPTTESLEDTLKRVLPYWQGTIVPALQAGKRVLVVAHGNSLRALVTYLDGIPEEAVPGLHIPTGVPRVYELDESSLQPRRRYYLDGPDGD